MTLYSAITLAFFSLTAPPKILVESHIVSGQPVVVVRPDSSERLPVVYALAGLGEMVRGPRASAHGWVEKYGLREAMTATMSKRLVATDLHGLVTAKDLPNYQNRVSKFQGVIVVCPAASRKYRSNFVRHLLQEVIPWVETHLPAKRGARHRGIDGISLGGRHALLVALNHPEAFRTVGTEQASVRGLWKQYKARFPKSSTRISHLTFNLLTSDADPFRPLIERFAAKLSSLHTKVLFKQTPGRHDKRFAKGPGAIEMLLFHDEHLRSPNSTPGSHR